MIKTVFTIAWELVMLVFLSIVLFCVAGVSFVIGLFYDIYSGLYNFDFDKAICNYYGIAAAVALLAIAVGFLAFF